MEGGKIQKFHKIVTVELLSTIDHKLRGVQQFIVALRGLVEDDVLNDLDEEVAELQALYEPYLKLRDLTLEESDIGKFIEDNYNIQTGVFCVIELDKEKLGFILDFLIEFSKGSYELSLSPTDKGCVVNFVSPAFAGLSVDDFNLLSSEIERLPFFAVRKILGRMNAGFDIKGEEISIEFPRYSKERN
ncbi:hypothetical protein JW879_00085 [candidate division WOR-3 bacterium]|nr:hypothetical protein [candidate division WOR-3 bacterium]